MPKSLIAAVAFLGLIVDAGCSDASKDRAASQPGLVETSREAGSPDSKPANSRTLDELLLFYPSKYPAGNWQPPNLAFEDAWFNAEDRTRLHGWYCPCENARAVLLYAHGNGGNLAQLSQLLTYFQNKLRVAALAFDYRGYGRSEGDPSVEGIIQDARAARAFLAECARVKPSEIVLMSRSLGGAVVAQLAGDVRPRGLIFESTFSSLRDEAAYHYPRLAWLVPENKLNSTAQLERYDGPLLVSHGDADRTIPYQLGLKLFKAAKGPKHFVTIPGGDHNDPQSAEYFHRLDEFIADLPN